MPNACAANTTATPCMMAVPSILMVAPSGIVKDEIFLDTPIFFASVSMDSGIVALDVAVENANAITGKKFLMNLIGFSPVNTLSSPRYTMRHWIARASSTPIIYFPRGRNALKPILANVLEIRQNTPIGARLMTIMVISIMISLNWPKKLLTVSARSPSLANITPMISAKTMICSMLPLARELTGLSGMMFSRVSVSDVASICATSAAFVLIALISSPTPGSIIFPTVRATVMARAVVKR